ncbi:MAG: hypothetical protein ABI353_08820 [Isosphaeraceae bacterium]
MNLISRSRVSRAVAGLAIWALILSGSDAFAQSSRAKSSNVRRPATVQSRRSANSNRIPNRSATAKNVRRQTSTVPNQHRYRGDNTDYFSKAFPAGMFPASGLDRGTLGTVDQVTDGYYVPGHGVNNGFAAPERVYGGFYTPGYGVNNGFASPYAVHGGMYMPGFGVMGGGRVNSGMGSQRVQGGSYVPGFGVMGGGSGGSSTSGAQGVQGGTYTPGFGVTGGHAPAAR